MLTPVECLKKEHSAIQVEIDFTKNTEMKRKYEELKESYEVAIGMLESLSGRHFQ